MWDAVYKKNSSTQNYFNIFQNNKMNYPLKWVSDKEKIIQKKKIIIIIANKLKKKTKI